MKTQARFAEELERDEITVRLFTRYYRLRKTRPDLLPSVLQEGSHLWTFTNPANPWGSKERLAFDEFATMVDLAEAAVRVAA